MTDGSAAPDSPMFGYLERFASVLVAAGFPPMPARVFVALLVTDSGRLTAADLAEVLRVSPIFKRLQRGHFVRGPDQPEFFRPLFFVKNKADVMLRDAYGFPRGE